MSRTCFYSRIQHKLARAPSNTVRLRHNLATEAVHPSNRRHAWQRLSVEKHHAHGGAAQPQVRRRHRRDTIDVPSTAGHRPALPFIQARSWKRKPDPTHGTSRVQAGPCEGRASRGSARSSGPALAKPTDACPCFSLTKSNRAAAARGWGSGTRTRAITGRRMRTPGPRCRRRWTCRFEPATHLTRRSRTFPTCRASTGTRTGRATGAFSNPRAAWRTVPACADSCRPHHARYYKFFTLLSDSWTVVRSPRSRCK